ncbi:hypothetical protein ATO7_08442 [Oceanococcus atlanticus]|uniref:Uncharacterized protein n=1 Tax=Oceanococcus atlanticus TaxID=1317117 RepID=A0A1Y1SED7_9GAMM|nr:hypothetical protein ATO7_08442 [Oceanococcus atlanticus]
MSLSIKRCVIAIRRVVTISTGQSAAQMRAAPPAVMPTKRERVTASLVERRILTLVKAQRDFRAKPRPDTKQHERDKQPQHGAWK